MEQYEQQIRSVVEVRFEMDFYIFPRYRSDKKIFPRAITERKIFITVKWRPTGNNMLQNEKLLIGSDQNTHSETRCFIPLLC